MEYLEYGPQRYEPDVRTLADMRDVLRSPDDVEGPPTRPLYYMYRDLSLSRADARRIRDAGLRYDITVIPPATLGTEWVKTMGHYHPAVPGHDETYAEVYEVLSGEALYLLQREEDGSVVEFRAVRAADGDKVVVPPGFGHVTVNPSNRVLKMCNWVSRDFESLYGTYAGKRGAAYHALSTGELVANPSYGDVPDIVETGPKSLPTYGLVRGREMYGLVRDLARLDFLTRPWEHGNLWDELRERG